MSDNDQNNLNNTPAMDDTVITEPVEAPAEPVQADITPDESLEALDNNQSDVEPTEEVVNQSEGEAGDGEEGSTGTPAVNNMNEDVPGGESSVESHITEPAGPAESVETTEPNNDLTPEELTPDMVGDNQAAVDSLLDNTNDNPDAKWFVVHTYSGHENKVATALKQRVEAEHLENKILDVIVPTQDKIEIRSGKKATVKEKIFPGYILVKMILDDNSWLAVRTTQGVTGFVGIGNKPTPIPSSEVNTIVRFMTQGAAPTFKDVFMVDDTVKIVDGPFSEFIGKIDSVDKEHGKVRVLVSIFGRETPVELDFLQVQKL